MKKEIIIIILLVIILIIKIVGAHLSENTAEIETYSVSSGSGNIDMVNTEDSEFSSIVSETAADELDINENDISSLTIDAESGDECNTYIPDLQTNGISSYVISPENDIFSYFCSQTLGGDTYDEFDMTGSQNPPIISGYFSNTHINQTVTYTSIMKYKDDVYYECYLDVEPVAYIDDGIFSQLNCDLVTIDSHNYFTPQKLYRTIPGQKDPEPYLTDTYIFDNLYSEYIQDFNTLGKWYGENTSMSIEDFINNIPPEDDLSLNVVDYNDIVKLLTELQKNVSENFIKPMGA